ncbi:MAG: RsmB/NOP family class I SAM-dependent RNA methyltransferase [Alphaproteobacteria bacterium]
MTPGARLQAAIELLDAIDADFRPPDRLMAAYTRARRYMGGGDRAAVRERVYGVMRRRARLDWWLRQAAPGLPFDGRRRVIADLALTDHAEVRALASLFDGGQYRAAPLAPDEAALFAALSGKSLDDTAQPDAVKAEAPDSLWPELAALGVAELQALNRPATVDLRVNALKATREEAIAALAAEGIASRPTGLSPWGLRLDKPAALDRVKPFRDGLVEVQDEASQVAALLTDAKPGMTVVDFCAGAGGKTLALAASMENRGRILACDIAPERLARMTPRLARAGVTIVESDAGGGAPESADRVLVDAPCSGSGTWRRDPAAKWRLTRERLAELVSLQAGILAQAAPLVREGGRLVYAVCSLIEAEGSAQVRRFLETHSSFAPVSARDLWPDAVGGAAPEGCGAFLRLTPARDGTDGFFAAILERRT